LGRIILIENTMVKKSDEKSKRKDKNRNTSTIHSTTSALHEPNTLEKITIMNTEIQEVWCSTNEELENRRSLDPWLESQLKELRVR